jgi:hypothetical protein
VFNGRNYGYCKTNHQNFSGVIKLNSFILAVFEDFNKENIHYCHWKSNNNLEPALSGIDDVDILVHRDDVNLMLSLLHKRNFYLAEERSSKSDPFVYHFYGLDDATGMIVHFHIYFRLVTGGSMVKNNWLPFEGVCLDNIHLQFGIKVLNKEVDLILFVIRKFLEQTSLVEHYLFYRDFNNVQRELHWLLQDLAKDKVQEILATEYPSFSFQFFNKCVAVLGSKRNSFIKRYFLGRKMHRLFPYRVLPGYIASFKRFLHYGCASVKGKLKIKRKSRVLFPGGKIIAFVGSDASSQSTLVKNIIDWYGENFDVVYVKFAKTAKSCGKIKNHCPMVAILRAINRALRSLKCLRLALAGTVVIADGYPAGPSIPNDKGRLLSSLYRIENYFYHKVPQPDVIFKFNSKDKETNEMHYNCIRLIELDAAENPKETLKTVKNHIW